MPNIYAAIPKAESAVLLQELKLVPTQVVWYAIFMVKDSSACLQQSEDLVC